MEENNSKEVSLLQEIIHDITDADKNLSSVLLTVYRFGFLNKNKELINYIDKELNGYKNIEDIPEYRKTKARLFLIIQGDSQNESKEISISMFEESFKKEKKLEYYFFNEGIATIKYLIDQPGDEELLRPLPMEILLHLQESSRKLYEKNNESGQNISIYNVIAVKMSCEKKSLLKIPDAVRTRLLELVMSIAKKFGYNIEKEDLNEKPESNIQKDGDVINSYHYNINYIENNNSGNGNSINTGIIKI